jgi:2-polyprenyl-6-methoxyphenol hydroxylase-like FAD-dependent oxidoreductase
MNILVSGAGIAGLAAANFLQRAGHSVTVIDKAPAFKKLGYALTVKNFGLKILAELGVRDELDKHALLHRRLQIYEPDGKLLKTFSNEAAQQATKGQVLILRSELHDVLYSAVRDRLPIHFGVYPQKVEQSAERVQVSLSNGEGQEFDLMVATEGLRSSTRRQLFHDIPAQGLHPIGVGYAAGQVAGEHGLDPTAVHMYFGSGRNIFLFPMTPNELVMQAYFRDATPADEPLDFSAGKLADEFRGFSSKITLLIENVGANGYTFFDSVAMIRLPELARGRVVFMGDAGHCPTFLSGMGASLGLLGAKVLHDALAQSPDVAAALTRYGAVMMPVAHHFQHNAENNVKLALAENPLKIALRDWLIHLVPPSLAALGWARQFDVEEKLLHGIV